MNRYGQVFLTGWLVVRVPIKLPSTLVFKLTSLILNPTDEGLLTPISGRKVHLVVFDAFQVKIVDAGEPDILEAFAGGKDNHAKAGDILKGCDCVYGIHYW